MGVYLWQEWNWSPWADTIAYYPLTSTTTVNDQSWSGLNLTWSGTYSFGTYWGVDCCYINTWMLQTAYSWSSSNPLTLSIWYNRQATPTNDTGVTIATWQTSWVYTPLSIGDNKPSSRPNTWDSQWGIYLFAQSASWSNRTASTDTHITASTWHYLCATSYNWTSKLYVDGVLVNTLSRWISNFNYLLISRWKAPSDSNDRSMKGYVSEAIFEKKERTAEEIKDYYNGTKSIYGIS